MARRSNKSIAEILTPPSPLPTTDILFLDGNNENNDNNHLALLERKISLATEGFTTHKFCELVLKDRTRLSKENALTICEYIMAMKREINPRLSYKKYTIQFLSELSRAIGIEKKFIDMTRDDVLCYLDNAERQKVKTHFING